MTKALASRLTSLSYFQRTPPPALDSEFTVLDLANEAGAKEACERYNIIAKSKGQQNLLYVHRDTRRLEAETRFEFNGANNTVIIDGESGFRGWLIFEGSDNLVTLLGGQSYFALGATLTRAIRLSVDAALLRGVSASGFRVGPFARSRMTASFRKAFRSGQRIITPSSTLRPGRKPTRRLT